MTLPSFTTHNGEVVDGERLAIALAQVADDWVALAVGIYTEDPYAPHVSQDTKEANLDNMLSDAELIRAGHLSSFTIIQRLNTKLTGVCVPLFSK